MATTFQRARSDEQRAERSRAILETAGAMLQEMPVADVSLNELSRRVGLAKSNVLRYFDSREDVLLQLLLGASREWLGFLSAEVPAAVSKRAGFPRRAEQLAATITASLVSRPVLCDLMAAQPGVLEHNVSAEAILKYKNASLDDADGFVELIHGALPEFGTDDVWRFMAGTWLMTSALWAHARPPEAIMQACVADERIGARHLEFPVALEDYLTTLAMGLHARICR